MPSSASNNQRRTRSSGSRKARRQGEPLRLLVPARAGTRQDPAAEFPTGGGTPGARSALGSSRAASIGAGLRDEVPDRAIWRLPSSGARPDALLGETAEKVDYPPQLSRRHAALDPRAIRETRAHAVAGGRRRPRDPKRRASPARAPVVPFRLFPAR